MSEFAHSRRVTLRSANRRRAKSTTSVKSVVFWKGKWTAARVVSRTIDRFLWPGSLRNHPSVRFATLNDKKSLPAVVHSIFFFPPPRLCVFLYTRILIYWTKSILSRDKSGSFRERPVENTLARFENRWQSGFVPHPTLFNSPEERRTMVRHGQSFDPYFCSPNRLVRYLILAVQSNYPSFWFSLYFCSSWMVQRWR